MTTFEAIHSHCVSSSFCFRSAQRKPHSFACSIGGSLRLAALCHAPLRAIAWEAGAHTLSLSSLAASCIGQVCSDFGSVGPWGPWGSTMLTGKHSSDNVLTCAALILLRATPPSVAHQKRRAHTHTPTWHCKPTLLATHLRALQQKPSGRQERHRPRDTAAARAHVTCPPRSRPAPSGPSVRQAVSAARRSQGRLRTPPADQNR